jgi:hypothetical protein
MEIPDIQARTLTAFEAGRLADLTPRELRDACAVILLAPNPPGRHPALRQAILDLVARRRVSSPVRSLIAGYLDRFVEDDIDIARLGAGIRMLIEDTSWCGCHAWLERSRAFGLFEAAEAPNGIARRILLSEQPPDETLRQAGLDTPARLNGGLSQAAFKNACAQCAMLRGPAAEAVQRRLIDWAKGTDGRLIFESAWPALFDAMLRPWESDAPSLDYRGELISRILDWGGGDPRLQDGRHWPAVKRQAPAAYAVMMRWLTQATVLQFLDIVGAVLETPEDRNMWAYRRPFWMSYLLGGNGRYTIEEAWIALGPEAESRARRIARDSGDQSFLDFGIQTVRHRTHSALLVRIGDWIVVDWSHNGKCQFWHSRDVDAPRLYQRRYGSEIYSALEQRSHAGSRSYHWQKEFARLLEGRAVVLERSAWRPVNV